jgi:ABC-type transport system involved in cytochrome c biogenesis ATPase subunit
MGHDLVAAPQEVRASIAMTGQFASLDEDLTGRENLILLARLWGFRGAAAGERADALLADFDLSDAARRQVKDYSGGMRRRLDIAASLVVTPGVLFLDEPTTGLDPSARQKVWRLIRTLAGSGVTVLLTTQYLEEADQLARRIAVVNHGRKIAEGTSRELKAATGSGLPPRCARGPGRARRCHRAAGSAARRKGAAQRGGYAPVGQGRKRRGGGRRSDGADGGGVRTRRLLDGNPEPRGGLLRAYGPDGDAGMKDTASDGFARVERPAPASAWSNALTFGWRAMLKFKHLPEQLFDLVMTPIMFTLLFTFVFGGAIAGTTGDYLQYLLPGILVQTVIFNSVYSGMGLSTDLQKGLFDRFRSLPIWPLAPFAGLMVGDILRHSIAGAIILGIGLALGFRPEAGCPA